MFSLPFSTVLLRRYLGWIAGEEWLLSRLRTVEVIGMTSWILWPALLGNHNLVSFHFCCCLILVEYYSKCDWVCASSVMFFCADSVQWESKTGVDHCRSCQQGFCCSGICLTFWANTALYCPFQHFLGQKASSLDQPCGAATMQQTGQWKPYYDLLEPVVGHAHPSWRI